MATDQALVVAGHGSHHDPRSAEPVYEHADRIRRRGSFDAVRAAFWKEQPSLAEVLATVEAESVYVVPLLTSEGYFADRVFPLELGLRETSLGSGRDITYTAPVGTHERLRAVIVQRIEAALPADLTRSDVGVALVGHGTERHERSADATVAHADRLRADGRYGAVEATFLDQSPNVADIRDRIERPDVVIVPLFVSNGLHVLRDIPAAIGLQADGRPFGGPTPVEGQRLWYTEAVGTAPSLTQVVLERAAEAGADVRADRVETHRTVSEAETAFLQRLDRGLGPSAGASEGPTDESTVSWGELAITVFDTDRGDRRYTVRHADDRGRPVEGLDRLESVAAVRKRTGTDDGGQHRPLRTARTLPSGWLFETADPTALVRGVRAVYPASIDHWYRDRAGTLRLTDFESVVSRQTGRYGDLDDLEPDTVTAAIAACCGDCVREPRWRTAEAPSAESDGTMPCPEPCSFLQEAARSFADVAPAATDEPVDPSVPAAAFDRPGNRYRVRYQQITQDRHRRIQETTNP